MSPIPLPAPVTTAMTWETSNIFELSKKVLSALPVVIFSGKTKLSLLHSLDKVVSLLTHT